MSDGEVQAGILLRGDTAPLANQSTSTSFGLPQPSAASATMPYPMAIVESPATCLL